MLDRLTDTLSPPVRFDVDGGIARLELNRPDAANAIDLDLATALADTVEELGRRDDVRAVLLTGAGERFCGGGDVRSFAEAGAELDARLSAIVSRLHIAVAGLGRLEVPVVVAVQGSAAGAGLALVAGADLVVAAESAQLVMAYTAIGLTPDGGSTWYLERIVGLQRALDLVLTNRVLSAIEAMEWGLVARVVPDAELRTEAEALVTRLAAGPTHAFGAAKRLLRSAPTASLAAQLEDEAWELVRAGGSFDAREGVAAFVEKRPPSFDGRPPP
jgi:2-(1,2-epoxy-1,2-dihydrophenyl)acetyl-CoA isomerase